MKPSDYEITGTKAIVPDMRNEAGGQERHALLVKGPNGVVTILAPTEEEARMFAASPKLLETCELLLAELLLQRKRRPIPEEEQESTFNPAVAAGRAAIAKAKPK